MVGGRIYSSDGSSVAAFAGVPNMKPIIVLGCLSATKPLFASVTLPAEQLWLTMTRPLQHHDNSENLWFRMDFTFRAEHFAVGSSLARGIFCGVYLVARVLFCGKESRKSRKDYLGKTGRVHEQPVALMNYGPQARLNSHVAPVERARGGRCR